MLKLYDFDTGEYSKVSYVIRGYREIEEFEFLKPIHDFLLAMLNKKKTFHLTNNGIYQDKKLLKKER
jgi:hypothetical protein